MTTGHFRLCAPRTVNQNCRGLLSQPSLLGSRQLCGLLIALLLRLDDDKDRTTAAIYEQEDGLAAAAANSIFKVRNRVHRLAIHLRDDVTLTETCVGRSRARIHTRHHDTLGSRRKL